MNVSVICAVKDRIPLLKRCYHSWSNQTYPDFEFVVVDDGSKEKDEVRLLSEVYFPDVKIRRLEREKDRTPAVAWNRGFEVSTGEFVIFTGGDTILSNYTAIQDILDSYDGERVSVLTYFLSDKHNALIETIDWKKDPKLIESLPGFWDYIPANHFTSNRLNLAAGLTTYVTGQPRKDWEWFGLFREDDYNLGSDQDVHIRERFLGRGCSTAKNVRAYHQWHRAPDVYSGSGFIYKTERQARLIDGAEREK